ncbi:hypothetical protein XENOCAPTIV_015017 [Xenoophorus captivus]|uniref:Uncharacterized protein n=1 Tax=Xenoophorus captivus TaxID=1517983 RepID=A0ABV0R8T1_9TELE
MSVKRQRSVVPLSTKSIWPRQWPWCEDFSTYLLHKQKHRSESEEKQCGAVVSGRWKQSTYLAQERTQAKPSVGRRPQDYRRAGDEGGSCEGAAPQERCETAEKTENAQHAANNSNT